MIVTFFYANLQNLWGVIKILEASTSGAVAFGYACIDVFLFFNVFLMTYRCFQILDAMAAQNIKPSLLDYFKVFGRKFCRIAPTYYILWIFLWCLDSRLSSSPNWTNALNPFRTCS